jgi:isopenicillin-N epimerase
MTLAQPDARSHWRLDAAWTFLNHGSFGACPAVVLDRQQELRRELESQPLAFLWRGLEPRLEAAQAALAAFVGAEPEDLVFVPNASTGVATVLASFDVGPGDELLTTTHVYNACSNMLAEVAHRRGARVVRADFGLSVRGPDEVVEAVLAAVTPRTRLALIDHVTSPTALVLPVAKLTAALEARGVAVLVDGAHAPGSVPLDVGTIGASWYTGNCHKWLCAPKGSAFLWARRDRQATLRPLVVSHGANSTRTDRSRFLLEFGWTGTCDPTPWLCIPEALSFMAGLHPGGIEGQMEANRAMVLAGRDVVLGRLGLDRPAPDSMLASMASIPLGDSTGVLPGPLALDATQGALLERRIEVPFIAWPAPPSRLVRLSAQAYNRIEDYERLADALAELL